jgi:hypothetical protein
MSEKNKSIKRKTSKVRDVEDVTGTGARKAAIRQVRARARELCKPGYNTVYYLRSAYKV